MAGEGRPRSNTGGDGSDERRRPERRANSVPPPSYVLVRSPRVPATLLTDENDSGDAELAAAIAASKAAADEQSAGDREMEEAMRQSREDEERRKRELAGQSGQGLFDEAPYVALFSHFSRRDAHFDLSTETTT